MTISYICNWCGEKYGDIVRAREHEQQCSDRPSNGRETDEK